MRANRLFGLTNKTREDYTRTLDFYKCHRLRPAPDRFIHAAYQDITVEFTLNARLGCPAQN